MPTPADRLRSTGRILRRAVLRRRRPLAAVCVAGAVAAAVHATAPPPPPTTTVLAAARDLPAGAAVASDDLMPVELDPGSVPDGTLRDPVGRVLAAPLRRGEPLTDVRLVGRDLAAAHPDLVTLPVRFPDSGVAALLEPGDRIDLVAVDPQGGGARVVAHDALVLATPPADGPDRGGATPGTVVVLGVPPLSAIEVSDASVRSFLSYVFTR